MKTCHAILRKYQEAEFEKTTTQHCKKGQRTTAKCIKILIRHPDKHTAKTHRTVCIKRVSAWQTLASNVNMTMLTRMDEVVCEVSLWLQLKVLCEARGMLFARETHRTVPSPGCADTAGSRHRHPNTVLGSRNVPGLAGETITSAGNRLVHSGFHTGHKPPEPGLSKFTCVGTADTAAEGVRPPSRHQCRSQEDLLHGSSGSPLFHYWPWLLHLHSPEFRITIQQWMTWQVRAGWWRCHLLLQPYWTEKVHTLTCLHCHVLSICDIQSILLTWATGNCILI